MKKHHYNTTIKWTGNLGTGTSGYKNYERSHNISAENKPDILGSSDAAFRGDKTKYNPEDMLVASVSACHMLWYLHLCSDAGVVVVDYTDTAEGIMVEDVNGGGRFSEIILNPQVIVKEIFMVEKAETLHQKAHELCFIANSLNCPVECKPSIQVLDTN